MTRAGKRNFIARLRSFGNSTEAILMSAISDAIAYLAQERAVIRGAPVAFVSTVLADVRS